MTILQILEFPDPKLRKIAKPVAKVDDTIKKLADNMLKTMYDQSGIGLAATQVNVHKRIVVMDLSEEKNEPWVFINPEITVLDDEVGEYDEGCLSVPGFHEPITRPKNIQLSALDKQGKLIEMEITNDLMSICIQHEIDHLNGRLFVDYLSSIKRQRIRKKLEKLHRQK